MKVLIRQEQKEDYDKVYKVVRKAFACAEHTNHDEQKPSGAVAAAVSLMHRNCRWWQRWREKSSAAFCLPKR